MRIQITLRRNGLCIVKIDGGRKSDAQRLHAQLFSRIASFNDNLKYRHRFRAPPLGGILDGQNFSRSSLLMFLRNVRAAEIHPIYRMLAQIRKAKYFITHLAGDAKTVRHEMRHFMFFHSTRYRDKCKRLWRDLGLRLRRSIHTRLEAPGLRYHRRVHLDEWQAFLAAEKLSFWRHVVHSYAEMQQLRNAKSSL